MRTTIHVTAEHIRDGVPEDGACCAVGLALKEVLRDGAYRHIDQVEVQVGPSTDAPHEHTTTPKAVADFITLFDHPEPCEVCSGAGSVEDGAHEVACDPCEGTGHVQQKQGCEPFSFELDLPADLLRAGSEVTTWNPASAGPDGRRPWRDVFGFPDGTRPTIVVMLAYYKSLALERHPDHGGSAAAMAELNRARDEALQELEND